MLSPNLETERLVLRRYKVEDVDIQYEIITDKRLSKYISFPNLSKAEELECIGVEYYSKRKIKNAKSNKY